MNQDERCGRSVKEGAKEQREGTEELARRRKERGKKAETNGIHRGASERLDGRKWARLDV